MIEKASISPRLATFTLVHVLKGQELYQRALDVLDILEQKGEKKYAKRHYEFDVVTKIKSSFATWTNHVSFNRGR